MSKIAYRSEDVIVYDDVLTSLQFEHLFGHLGSLTYRSVHADAWRPVWRLHDGNPLHAAHSLYCHGNSAASQDAGEQAVAEDGIQRGRRSESAPAAILGALDKILSPHRRIEAAKEAVRGRTVVKPSNRYPTETPIDILTEWIIDKLPEVSAIIGAEGGDWSQFSITPWIYPPGSGLSLHMDGITYSGAFTFFAHPKWHLHWGGLLIVLDPRTRPREIRPGKLTSNGPMFINDELESAMSFDPGIALTIFPKPNRIVFISPTAQHMLTRVDVNAGQASRVSIAGFFHKEPVE